MAPRKLEPHVEVVDTMIQQEVVEARRYMIIDQTTLRDIVVAEVGHQVAYCRNDSIKTAADTFLIGTTHLETDFVALKNIRLTLA